MVYRFNGSIQQWINECQTGKKDGRCVICNGRIFSKRKYDVAPPVVAINIEGQQIPIEDKIYVETDGDNVNTYNLCGVIYLGDFHFVSRLIDKANNVWFYDGACKDACRGQKQGKLRNTDSNKLLQCGSKKASLVMYILDRSEPMTSN